MPENAIKTLVAFGLVLCLPASLAAQPLFRVLVTNTEDEAVPVAGTVRVETPPRQLVGAPLNVDVTDVSSFPPPGADWGSVDFLEVPGGDHFVLESVNVQGTSEQGGLQLWLDAVPPGQPFEHVDDRVAIPLQEGVPGFFAAFVNARWYMESGYRIRAHVHHEGGTGEAGLRIVLIGYFESGCGHISGLEGDPSCP